VNRKTNSLAATLAALAFLLAGCGGVVTGKVVGNGKTPTACTADPNLPVAVSVETNEVDTQADGKLGKIVKVVCLSEQEASQYPLGSTYPNK
jgi:hypothetical protein